MPVTSAATIAALLTLSLGGFWLARKRAAHSLPAYHAGFLAIACVVPGLAVWLTWMLVRGFLLRQAVVDSFPAEILAGPPQEIELLMGAVRSAAQSGRVTGDFADIVKAGVERYEATGLAGSIVAGILTLIAALAGGLLGWRHINPRFRARNVVERAGKLVLAFSSTIAVFITIGIVGSLLFEALRFFEKVPFTEFFFGLNWSPQTAIRSDQVGSSGEFGAVPLFAGTLVITFVAMLIAVPVGLMSAIYMAEYASPRLRNTVKPILEILAGIPTVVYGFFAALTVAPYLRSFGDTVGLDVASESALAAGLVMGVMIIPFISSISDDVITAVPMSLREGSLALGATESETIKRVLIPAALPGIVAGFLLAVSRAIGETMIVVMAAGLAANLTANPFQAVTTVTVQIVTLLVGDQEFDSAKTLAAFALGLVLFVATLILNVIAFYVVRRFREQYD
jgi:phosphate transport system permease protein